ncbi:hypothetical protein GB928_027630, partial [Shinella curvata]
MASVSCDDFPVERGILAQFNPRNLKYSNKINPLSIFSFFMKSAVDAQNEWAYNPAIERERRRFWRPTNSL